MDQNEIPTYREFLKDSLRLKINFHLTDQNQGVEPPPLQKPPHPEQRVITLPGKEAWKAFAGTDLIDAIDGRQSHRWHQSGLSRQRPCFSPLGHPGDS